MKVASSRGQRKGESAAMPNELARGMQLLRVPIRDRLTSDDVRLTTDVKLRGPEGAQRLRATSASTTS
jgi:hypothetical protein